MEVSTLETIKQEVKKTGVNGLGDINPEMAFQGVPSTHHLI